MIEWRKVSKQYQTGNGAVSVLQDVDWELQQGDFCALVGRSGTGKSTVLNLTGGLDKPTSGEILFEDKHLETMRDDELSHFRNASVGFVFQSFFLQPLRTAMDNVMVPLLFGGAGVRQAGARAKLVLEEVGLQELAGTQVRRLSGGQRQRVAIARAIANQPRLLLADEPTGNLDTATSLEIFQLLHDYNAQHKTTILVVTHDPLVEQFKIPKLTIRDGKLETHTGAV